MTEIEIRRSENVIVEIKISGHANSAPYGQDLICNAISVATQFIGIGICDVLKIEPETLIFEPEIPNVHFVLSKDQGIKCSTITETFFEYMSLFSMNYSNYLKMGVQNE